MKYYEIHLLNYDENNIPFTEKTVCCISEEPPTLEQLQEIFEDFESFNCEEISECVVDDYDLIIEQCQWCEEFFLPSEGKTELNMGFLCNRCIGALWSRGEKLCVMEEL